MVKTRIEQTLQRQFSPMHLEVTNESHMHNVPTGSESHFKVVIVSDAFKNQGLITRHRAVNQALVEEFEQGLHAMALHTMTPDEWFKKGGIAPDSPLCMGGNKQEQS